jgi:hypothetical protein
MSEVKSIFTWNLSALLSGQWILEMKFIWFHLLKYALLGPVRLLRNGSITTVPVRMISLFVLVLISWNSSWPQSDLTEQGLSLFSTASNSQWKAQVLECACLLSSPNLRLPHPLLLLFGWF